MTAAPTVEYVFGFEYSAAKPRREKRGPKIDPRFVFGTFLVFAGLPQHCVHYCETLTGGIPSSIKASADSSSNIRFTNRSISSPTILI